MARLKDELKKKKQNGFIGRREELAVFTTRIHTEDYSVIYIYGQGGVGKTTLLNQYRSHKDDTIKIAYANEEQTEVLKVLEKFADDLEDQGVSVGEFREKLGKYEKLCNKTYDDSEFREKVAGVSGGITGRSVRNIFHVFAPERMKAMEEIIGGGEKIDKGVANLFQYAQRKFKKESDFKKVLELGSDKGMPFYIAAVGYARLQVTDKACEYLRIAIEKEPSLEKQALTESGFDDIRNDELFPSIIREFDT